MNTLHPSLRVILSYLNKKSNSSIVQYMKDSFDYTREVRKSRVVEVLTKHVGEHTGLNRYKGGSVFFEDDGKGGNLIKTPHDLLQRIYRATWTEITDPDPTCRKFVTEDIQGLMGLVNLKDVPHDPVNPVQITYRPHKKGDTGQVSIRGHINSRDVPKESSLDKPLGSTVFVIQRPERPGQLGGYLISLYPTNDPSASEESVSPQPRKLPTHIRKQVEANGFHSTHLHHATGEHELGHALLD